MHPRPLALLALAGLTAFAADTPGAASVQICTSCHAPAPGNILGYLEEVTPKARAIQVRLHGTTALLRYDRATLRVLPMGRARTAEAALKTLKMGQAVRIEYAEKAGVKTATLVSIKPSLKLEAADLITTAEIERLVALGPERGHYFLYDARPQARFDEGTIPTAINLPFPAFDAYADRLPADKQAQVIFFCHGQTCTMGACALAKVRGLGYTQARVYQEGMPGWYAKHYGVVSPASYQAAFLDREIPTVLLDLRPAEALQAGFIKGAVAVAPAGVKDLLADAFPAARLRPPILVVDDAGGDAAKEAAMELVRAGYTHVNVLAGGFQAWLEEALPLETGAPATRVAYAPKLPAGAIPGDEFTRIASLAPKDRKGVLILDVRSRAEARGGMIKGALNLPHDELEARLSELPKDRRILIHCGTGALAGPACDLLRRKGYDAAYLNAEITIIDTGEFVTD